MTLLRISAKKKKLFADEKFSFNKLKLKIWEILS